MASDADLMPRERPNPETLFPFDKAAGLDPFANKPVNVLLTFEGGGAKGIVHLGAYRELEYAMAEPREPKYDHWPRYQLRGVSGTSIGALVAALIAVGYTSREMLPEPPPRPPRPPATAEIPTLSRSQRVAKVTKWVWFRLRYAWASLKYYKDIVTGSTQSIVLKNAGLNRVTSVFGIGLPNFFLLKFLVTHPFVMFGLLMVVWTGSVYLGIRHMYPVMRPLWDRWDLSKDEPFLSIVVVAVITVTFLGLGLRWLLRGLLTTKPFANAIDLALAKKLLEKLQHMTTSVCMEQTKRDNIVRLIDHLSQAVRRKRDYSKVVTFQMLRDAGCQPLAMVATNVRSTDASHVRSMGAIKARAGAVELFSNDATPKVIVADAIAASAALPILFRPVEIETHDKGGLYWDGGFTSNLPAWTFDAQREINPDLHTLTIEIAGHVPSRSWGRWNTFRPFRDFLALVITSVFGARELETRRTRRAGIEINTEVRLLDFNMSPVRAHNEIEWSRRGLRASLNMRASVRKLYADKCLRISQAVRNYLMGPPPFGTIPRIRVSLLQPTRHGARALKTLWRFCSRGSFRTDTDDRLLFRKETSVPGLAWARFDAVLKNVQRSPDRVIWIDPNQPNSDVGPRHRYSHRLLWNQMEWMLAVPVARDPDAVRGTTDWVVAIDSNIPLDLFEFASGEGKAYQDLVKAIREIASELWEVEDKAKTAAENLNRQMGVAA